MVRVAPIKLFYSPHTLWFDPADLDIHAGDDVVVTTARGVEFGTAAGEVFEVSEADVKRLKTALKPVRRLATDNDRQAALEMERKSAEALPVFKEMAAGMNADMHPVSVEYLLEGNKAVFYFESEERVDFRDLVRKLASRFHVRVDMRQIGVRDEARMVGGLGHCGQELCCRRMGGRFCPVSIRMAKEQDLSLNPQKISGLCGRLMCCLRYEYDAYKDFHGRAPKQNATVQTPDGPAKVVDLDVPREVVSLRLEGEKSVKVSLSDLETEGGAARPNRIGEEAWERANTQGTLTSAGGATYLTSQFTGKDKLAKAGSVRHVPGGAEKGRRRGSGASGDAAASGEGTSRKPRRRHSAKAASGEEAQAQAQGPSKAKGKQKKKQSQKNQAQQASPSKKKQGGKKAQAPQAGGPGGAKGKNKGGASAGGGAKTGPRPGQKSSGLRQGQQARHMDAGKAGEGNQPRPRPQRSQDAAGAAPSGAADEHRRPRRRSRKAGGAQGSDAGAQNAQGTGGSSGGRDASGGQGSSGGHGAPGGRGPSDSQGTQDQQGSHGAHGGAE